MSLNVGETITASDFNSLKDEIKTEINRRDRYTFTFTDSNVSSGNQAQVSEANNLINVLRVINANTTNYSTVSAGNLIQSLIQLQIATATFRGCAYREASGNNSGCSSSCVGLCTNCTGNCTGGCSGGCQDRCATNCTGGCGGTCRGSCSGSCTGCSNACAPNCTGNCAGTCSGTCTGGCSGGCSGNYYN